MKSRAALTGRSQIQCSSVQFTMRSMKCPESTNLGRGVRSLTAFGIDWISEGQGRTSSFPPRPTGAASYISRLETCAKARPLSGTFSPGRWVSEPPTSFVTHRVSGTRGVTAAAGTFIMAVGTARLLATGRLRCGLTTCYNPQGRAVPTPGRRHHHADTRAPIPLSLIRDGVGPRRQTASAPGWSSSSR